jgi:hypothetical protein
MTPNGNNITPGMLEQACSIVRACCPGHCPAYALLQKDLQLQEQRCSCLQSMKSVLEDGGSFDIPESKEPIETLRPSRRPRAGAPIEVLTYEDDMRKLEDGPWEILRQNWHVFSAKQKQVLQPFHRDGMSMDQIAKGLGTARSSVFGRIVRAWNQLPAELRVWRPRKRTKSQKSARQCAAE